MALELRVAWILVMPKRRMKNVLTGAEMVTSSWCGSTESWTA